MILKKFNNEIFLSVPLTKRRKFHHQYYFLCFFRKNVMSSAILSQIRLLDSKRLRFKIGYVSKENFIELKTNIRQLFA